MADTFSIRLGIEDQQAVDRAFAAIADKGEKALGTIRNAAATTSQKLSSFGADADRAAGSLSQIAALSSTAASGLAGIGLEPAAAAAIGFATAVGDVATALRVGGAVADQAASGIQSFADSQLEARGAATELATAQRGVAEASGISAGEVVAWGAAIAGVAVLSYGAYKTVQGAVTLVDEATTKLGELVAGDFWTHFNDQAAVAARRQAELAAELGVTAASLKATSTVAAEFGVSEDKAVGIARHLIEVLDDQSGKASTARKALEAYGLQIDGLSGKDWAQVLDAWVVKMNATADSAAKTRANLAVLGSDGTAALHKMANAGGVTSSELGRIAELTAELERRIAVSLDRQTALAGRKGWWENLLDGLDQAISRTEEFKLKQALAIEPAASGWSEFWATNSKGADDMSRLWDRMVESASNYYHLIGGKLGVTTDFTPEIYRDTRAAAPSLELIEYVQRLRESYYPAEAAARKYQEETTRLAAAFKAGAMSLPEYIDLLNKSGEALTKAAPTNGDKARAIIDSYDPAAAALKKFYAEVSVLQDGLADGTLTNEEFAAGIEKIGAAYSKATAAGAGFASAKKGLEDQLYGVGRSSAEVLQHRLESEKNDDGSAKYTADEIAQLVRLQRQIEAANESQRAYNKTVADARQIADAYATPLERYNQKIEQINASRPELVKQLGDEARAQEIVNQALLDAKIAYDKATSAGQSYDAHVKDYTADLSARASRIYAATRTPAEKYQSTVEDISGLYNAGALDDETTVRGLTAAWNDYQSAVSGANANSKILTSSSRELGSAIGTAFEDAIIKGKSFSSILGGLAEDIERIAIRALITKPLENWFTGIFSGFSLAAADGHAFNGAGVIPFAKGSAFTNKIYDQPTPFRFANGGSFSLGVMGEAGAEAVMPLTRAQDGSLGVRASGSSGGVAMSVTNQITINAPSGSGGSLDTQKLAKQAASAVDQAMSDWVRKQQRPGGALWGKGNGTITIS